MFDIIYQQVLVNFDFPILVFESRWGNHTLKWVAGGKGLSEENVSGQSRSVVAWAREGPVKGGKEGAGDALKLW